MDTSTTALITRPVKVITLIIAVPMDGSLEDTGLMDLLSDARDDSEGRLIEWNTLGGERIIDAESAEARVLFDSSRLSPITHPEATPDYQLYREALALCGDDSERLIEVLDGMTHDAQIANASEVNNQGPEAQIAALLAAGVRPETVRAAVMAD